MRNFSSSDIGAMKRNHLFVCLLLAGFSAGVQAQNIQTAGEKTPEEREARSSSDARMARTLDSITVTAARRATSIEKTPIAMTAITAETIGELGATHITDYAAQVPGLRIQYSGPGASRINLRGINSSGEATVGVYNDETPISGSVGTSNNAGGRSADMNLFDVDRIEVLRGPQGTLYGASSMGGAIRILYQKPTNELDGRFEGGYEVTSGGDPSHSQNFMFNVPLVDDLLAARLTAYNRETGGYVDNTFLDIDNVNSVDSKGAKLQLRYTPTDDITVDFSHSRETTEAFSGTWHPSEGDYKQLSQVKLPYEDASEITSLTFNWNLHWAELSANVSRQDRDSTYIGDDSYYIGTYLTPARCQSAGNGGVACSPERLQEWYAEVNSLIPAALIHDGNTTDRTAELRLTSVGTNALDWTVGLFRQDRDNYVASQDAPADAETGIIITPWDLFYRRNIWDNLEQTAVFGEVTWHATDRLNLTAGLRYYDYTKTITGSTDIPWVMIGANYRPLTTVDASEDGFLKKFTADFNFSENLMVYATVADGFRPGGANQVIGLAEVLTAYDSDSLWNYEVGMKSAWLDRSLLFNAALYRIEWENMQVSGQTLNGAFSFLSNAGAARIDGVELEAIWRPIAGLNLSANYNYVDGALSEDQISEVISSTGRAGDPIPGTPRQSGMLAAAYRFPVTSDMDGMVRLDGTHVGGSYSLFRGANNVYREAYTTFSFRAGLESTDSRWAAYLYVQNLSNEVAMNQYTQSSTPPYGTATSIRPRTIGANVTYNF